MEHHPKLVSLETGLLDVDERTRGPHSSGGAPRPRTTQPAVGRNREEAWLTATNSCGTCVDTMRKVAMKKMKEKKREKKKKCFTLHRAYTCTKGKNRR